MEFIPTLSSYSNDLTSQTVWQWFNNRIENEEGVSFYKYPNVGGPHTPLPDLTIVTRHYQPAVVRCLGIELEQIISITEDTWTVDIGGEQQLIDSPLMELDDIVIAMQAKFDRERPLRQLFKVQRALALPLIERTAFEHRFGELDFSLWNEVGIAQYLLPISQELTDDQWRLTQSVIQAAVPLSRQGGPKVKTTPKTLGEALKQLDHDIALLDMEQQRAATQIPPGPQRIRGLAGTGKTVLLALKAANIHRQFPDAKILFTFNTQSLYNQSQLLISKFYRHFSGIEPDFEHKVHVRHAWGGRARAGVYSEACKRNNVPALNFFQARTINRTDPFRACCVELLKQPIAPHYDFVLMDEGQDFPKEFYRVIYALAKGTTYKSIYFAYDELQSLSAVEVPSTAELFGSDANGTPLVSLDGEYPGPIDKDFILHKSYRCPREVLMIAHALGLGLYRKRGPVQMLADRSSWQSVGYEVTSGELQTGVTVIVERPVENSPNRVADIYPSEEVFRSKTFETRDAELDYVADEIRRNIVNDGLHHEDILVVSLDSRHAKAYMTALQAKLWKHSIASTIPGLVDSQDEFAEPGKVTLATIYRAKGNEAPMVYIIGFDSLSDYVEEIGNRNRAFTAISRSKAWVRVSGVGIQMATVVQEIVEIRARLPKFEFKFPDMRIIRKLEATETNRRRKEVRKAQGWAQNLAKLDPEAIRKLDPALLKELRKMIGKATNDGE
jgi:superfamily I DNA and RNA helicase